MVGCLCVAAVQFLAGFHTGCDHCFGAFALDSFKLIHLGFLRIFRFKMGIGNMLLQLLLLINCITSSSLISIIGLYCCVC